MLIGLEFRSYINSKIKKNNKILKYFFLLISIHKCYSSCFFHLSIEPFKVYNKPIQSKAIKIGTFHYHIEIYINEERIN